MSSIAREATRSKAALLIAALLVLLLGLSIFWIARAQQNPAAGGPRFTGQSTALESEGLRISRRHFEPGARSDWHRHTHGQLLFVEEGRARTQKRGAALREMGAGESDYTAPNVEHWHGAVPDADFVQVAVGFGEGTEWLEPVSDDQYNGR